MASPIGSMNIEASIVDQRLSSIIENIRGPAKEQLKISDPTRLKSLAFVYLCVKTVLDLDGEETFDCLTEGGGDFGVDAIHLTEEYDGEFTVSLFQAKYKHTDFSGNSNFPESGMNSLIRAIGLLFNPAAELQHINARLLAKVEQARSLIRDGFIPQVRSIACNNGLKWNSAADEAIACASFGDQVTWEHINHTSLVKILQASRPVTDSLSLNGKAIVEDMDFSRILVGRISVTEIAELISRHGDRLLERNIRRYLGLQGNRVNEAIRLTLETPERSNFYFYNNGITLTCDKFSYNALQGGDYQVKVENLQIINGGQTCMTIFQTMRQATLFPEPVEAYVLLRLYQLPSDNEDLVQRITFATNSQNPVDLRDLRANDEVQRRLEMDISQLGFSYRRKRSDSGLRPLDITSGVAAEAILSVWRHRPHQAKFFTREHFGRLYGEIFSHSLNGSQVILAVQLYRIAENRRKRPEDFDPTIVCYASCFIAMQMGRRLISDLGLADMDGISHLNFKDANDLIAANGNKYYSESLGDIRQALSDLYGGQEVSLQQLSATFRRGDLIEKLERIDVSRNID
jgi:hypothetical protein